MNISSTRGGKARKKSTYTMVKPRTTRLLDVEARATIRPPARPRGTTTMVRISVIQKPGSRIGHACARMSRLKKLRANCSIRRASPPSPFPCEARLDPAAEYHHGNEEDQVGHRAEQQRRRVIGERVGALRLVENLAHRDHRAERGVLGDGDGAVGERR